MGFVSGDFKSQFSSRFSAPQKTRLVAVFLHQAFAVVAHPGPLALPMYFVMIPRTMLRSVPAIISASHAQVRTTFGAID